MTKTKTRSPMRARMIEQMKIGSLAPATQQHYLARLNLNEANTPPPKKSGPKLGTKYRRRVARKWLGRPSSAFSANEACNVSDS